MRKYVISVLEEKVTEKTVFPTKVLEKKEVKTLSNLKKLKKEFEIKYPGKEILILENYYGKWRELEI